MKLLRVVLSRVLLSCFTLMIVSVLIFAFVEVLPGDVAERILGRDATEASVASLRERMGLNEPAPTRYVRWLSGVLRGDLGRSHVSSRPVTEILAPKVFNTLMLSTFALLLYVPIALTPAIIQAVNLDKPIDHFLSVVTLVLLAIPDFLLATILLLTFVLAIPLFPATSNVGETTEFWPYLRALVLPGITLTIVMAIYAVRMLRDSLVEVLNSAYVRMAELKGLPLHLVIIRHALPNALGPTLNVTALNLGYLIGGVMIVEKVFAFPGYGTLLVNAIRFLDIAVIEACVLLAAVIYIVGNLLADIVTIALNPKLQKDS